MAPAPPISKDAPTSNAPRRKHQQQQCLEIYTTCSTGHQVSNGVSKPASYHAFRQTKINHQFRISTISSSSTNNGVTKKPPTLSLEANKPKTPTPSFIFKDCSIFISGTTAPIISDHALKRLLVQHGAQLKVIMQRKSTTHVVMGQPAKAGGAGGAGGGLAAGKLQKEIMLRSNKLRFVTVQWVLDSIEAGRRQPEKRYEALAIRSGGQKSIITLFGKNENAGIEKGNS